MTPFSTSGHINYRYHRFGISTTTDRKDIMNYSLFSLVRSLIQSVETERAKVTFRQEA